MKKIAQGRKRRQDRQLQAAERQAASTAKRLQEANDQLSLRQKEKANPVILQSIDRWKANVKWLTDKLAVDQNRLQQLKSGNYPA